MQITDVDGERSIEIDAKSAASPDSVFLVGPRGLCLEFDRFTFLELVAREFGSEIHGEACFVEKVSVSVGLS